jgi:hypothetical protein
MCHSVVERAAGILPEPSEQASVKQLNSHLTSGTAYGC